jgi:hypothetical protein
MIIGCDIGGVVKQMTSENPIFNSLETIDELEKLGHEIVFISKCKANFQNNILDWLKCNSLKNKIYFCKEYSEKCALCKKIKM